MPKPVLLKVILQVLKQKGFFFISQKGSHAKYRTITQPIKTVIIKTGKKEIPYGTFQSILLQSGLSEIDFKK